MNKRQQLYGSPSQWTGPQGHTVVPCETLTGIPPGPRSAQWYLQGHLNPSVFYCLVSGSEWISEELNIQIKTKIKESGISSHCLFQGVKGKALRQALVRGARLGICPGSGRAPPTPAGLPFTFSPVHLETNNMGKTHMLGDRTEWAKHTCLWETWPPT